MKVVPYACHKCGSTIEEGTTFCPHCGAPQIRVNMPAEPPSNSPAYVPGTPAEIQPPAEPVPLSSLRLPAEPGAFSMRGALPAALMAGIGIGIGSLIPLGLAWIILVIGTGGAFAVIIQKRRNPASRQMGPTDGAKLGTVASLIGYAIFAVVTVFLFVVNGTAMRQEIMRRMQEMKSPDPAMQQTYDQIMQKLATPEGMALMVTVALAFLFVFFLAIGAAGGAIGATLTHREHQR